MDQKIRWKSEVEEEGYFGLHVRNLVKKINTGFYASRTPSTRTTQKSLFNP